MNRRVGGILLAGAAGRWANAPTVRASRDGDGFRLTGAAAGVVDAGGASDLLVIAEGPALFQVDAGAAGLVRRHVPTMDLTRPLFLVPDGEGRYWQVK